MSADRDARLRTARSSPEIANRHDKAAWLALYTDDAIVEDPVGTPVCQRGVRSLGRSNRDDLERFYATFIAPTSLEVESKLDVVVRDTVVRDVVLHVKLPGGARGAIPAVLEYELDASSGSLRVRRMRAYWDARKNGRAVLAQGMRGKLTSLLSGARLLRHFGRDWTRRYMQGTQRGIKREGAPIVRAVVLALAEANHAKLADLVIEGATLTLPGSAPAPLASAAALKLTIEDPICSSFTCVSRCLAHVDGRDVQGILFVEIEPSSKKVVSVRVFWER